MLNGMCSKLGLRQLYSYVQFELKNAYSRGRIPHTSEESARLGFIIYKPDANDQCSHSLNRQDPKLAATPRHSFTYQYQLFKLCKYASYVTADAEGSQTRNGHFSMYWTSS